MPTLLSSFSAQDWALMLGAIVLAYVVFGIAGFGTALVAGPLLLHRLPLAQVIPLLVLLDFLAASGSLFASRRHVARPELLRLLPCMALGCVLGVTLLLGTRADLLLLAMGVFVSAYALYTLLVKARPAHLAAAWALPAGTLGGLFGALFGSGGFLYALYLNGRLGKMPARATQSALISCSTLVRLGLFLLAGVYADLSLVWLALCLLPAMLAGLWVGRRATLNLSHDAFVRLLNGLVLACGLALIVRYLGL